MTVPTLVLVLTLGTTVTAVSASTAGIAHRATVTKKKPKVPKDACTLVTDEQVAVLVPSATSEPSPKQPGGVGCYWDDGREVPESFASFSVDVRKLIGIPLDQVKLSLQVEAKDADEKPIKGLGTFAFQHSPIAPNSEVKILLGKLLVTVTFSGEAPVTDEQEATTLEIAKAVIKKL